MQNKLFLKAADICELLEVKQTSAYEIIGNLNKELEEQGYLTLRGKVPTKYFVKRFYGVEDTCEIPQEEGKSWKFLIFFIIRNIICLISSIREIIQYYFVD